MPKPDSETPHTPLNWYRKGKCLYEKNELGSWLMVDCEDHSAEHLRHGEEERAEFVLRACNAYEQEQKVKAALVEALERLTALYLVNQRTTEGGEFVACITPPHASDMTPAQRKKDNCWAAWDKARAALKLAKGE